MRLAAPEGHPVIHPAFVDQRLLVAEDEPLIAIDLARILNEEGATVIQASSVPNALRLIETSPLSAGVIDIRLGVDDAGPICDALHQRRVPFVFFTGDADAPPQRWRSTPVVGKPTMSSVIVGALKYAITADRRGIFANTSQEIAGAVVGADQRIIDAEERIARVRRLMARLHAIGFDTTVAGMVLATMIESLDLMREHRRRIASQTWTRSMVPSPKV